MRPLYIFLFSGLILGILFSSGQIENPDTHLRLTQARIILNDHKFGLATDVGEDMHGNIAIGKGGQRYMVYNPGQTFIFISIYFISDLYCSDEAKAYYNAAFYVSFLNYMVHALCAFLLFKIALLTGSTKRQAYFVSAIFGLTSYSFVLAQSTYEHHFEMFFILLSTYYALNKNTKHSGLFTGLMLSVGLIFRTTTILAVPAILILQADVKERLKALSGLAPGICFVLLYNFYRFGDPFESGYSLAWSLAHSKKFDYWSASRIPKALFGFMLSPAKGLFFFSPTILLAIIKLKVFWQKQRVMSYSIVLISVIYLVLFSMNFAWHGSIWSFGPRYILPIVPFLYLPLVYFKPPKWIFAILLVCFILQVELISVNYKRDLLVEFVKCNRLSDEEYIFDISKEPHLVQAKQLSIIIPKNFDQLHNYFPNTAWKKEVRTAPNEEVINTSIEKNAVNFWWVRMFHWKTSWFYKMTTVLLLISALLGTVIFIRYVKRAFI